MEETARGRGFFDFFHTPCTVERVKSVHPIRRYMFLAAHGMDTGPGMLSYHRQSPTNKRTDISDIAVGARIPPPAVRDEGGRSANEPQSAGCGSILHDNGELRTGHWPAQLA